MSFLHFTDGLRLGRAAVLSLRWDLQLNTLSCDRGRCLFPWNTHTNTLVVLSQENCICLKHTSIGFINEVPEGEGQGCSTSKCVYVCVCACTKQPGGISFFKLSTPSGLSSTVWTLMCACLQHMASHTLTNTHTRPCTKRMYTLKLSGGAVLQQRLPNIWPRTSHWQMYMESSREGQVIAAPSSSSPFYRSSLHHSFCLPFVVLLSVTGGCSLCYI